MVTSLSPEGVVLCGSCSTWPRSTVSPGPQSPALMWAVCARQLDRAVVAAREGWCSGCSPGLLVAWPLQGEDRVCVACPSQLWLVCCTKRLRLGALRQAGCESVAAQGWQVSGCSPDPDTAQLLCRESGLRVLGATLLLAKKKKMLALIVDALYLCYHFSFPLPTSDNSD